MGSNSSFYNQNSTVYTETNPAGPADTPVPSLDTDAASSFFKATGGVSPATIIAGIHEFTPIAHQFLTGVDSSGVFSSAQPSVNDLLGLPLPGAVLFINATGQLDGDEDRFTWDAVNSAVYIDQRLTFGNYTAFDPDVNVNGQLVLNGNSSGGLVLRDGNGDVYVGVWGGDGSIYMGAGGSAAVGIPTYFSIDQNGQAAFSKKRDPANAYYYQFNDAWGLISDTAGGFWRGVQFDGGSITQTTDGTSFPRASLYWEFDATNNPTARSFNLELGNTSANTRPKFHLRIEGTDFYTADYVANKHTWGANFSGNLSYDGGTLNVGGPGATWVAVVGSDTGLDLSNGTQVLRMGSDGRMRLNSQNNWIEANGRVSIAEAVPTSVDGGTGWLHVVNNNNEWSILTIACGANNGGGGQGVAKTRGANPTTQVILQAGDTLWGVTNYASDGFNYIGTSYIQFRVANALITPGYIATEFAISTGGQTYGAERLLITYDGQTVLSQWPTPAAVDGSYAPRFQVQGWQDDVDHRGDVGIYRWNADTVGSRLFFAKSHNGTSIGSHTIVTVDENLGEIYFNGSDGSAFQRAAAIIAAVDGTPGAGSVPARLLFKTYNSDDAALLERVRIDSGGAVVVGGHANIDWGGYATRFNILGVDYESGSASIAVWNSGGWYPALQFYRSKNAVVGSHATVAADDTLGLITVIGDDGTNNITSSQIWFEVDGTVAAGVVPGRVRFLTADTTGTAVERFRIDSGGNFTFVTASTVAGISIGTGSVYCSQVLNAPGVADGVYLADVYGPGSTPNYGNLRLRIDDATGGSEDSGWRFGVITAGASSEAMRINGTGVHIGPGAAPTSKLDVAGPIATQANTIVTGVTTYAVTETDSALVFNCAATCTITLPSAAACPGRWITLKTIAAFTVVSASSNVCPATSNTPGTAILTAVAGRYAVLQSDGTNWIKMYGGTGA